MKLINYYLSKPSAGPSASNTSGIYLIAHRRVNQNNLHTEISPITPNVGFPVTLTPQDYSDSFPHKRDEFLVSTDGVTWQVIPRDNDTDTGLQNISEYSASWVVTSISDNQEQDATLLDFGQFSGGSNPEAVIYALNEGSTANSVTFEFTDNNTNLPLSDFEDRITISLEELRGNSGNNANIAFNSSLVWSLPSNSNNSIGVAIPSRSFIKLRISLSNFPSGGLQSIVYSFNFAVTANKTTFALSYPDQWVEGSLVYDPSINLNTDLLTSDGATISIAPYIRKDSQIVRRNVVTQSLPLTVDGTYNLYESNGVFSVVLASDPQPSSFQVATFDYSTTVAPYVTNIVYPWPIRTFDFGFGAVSGSLARARFVTINGSGNIVLATTTNKLVGISLKEDEGFYAKNGVAWLQVGEAVSVGDALNPGTDGKGFITTDGAAIALQNASTDGYCLVELTAIGAGTGGAGGATSLGQLTDVDLTTPATDGQGLYFDSASGDFLPGDPPASSSQTPGGSNFVPLANGTTAANQSSIDISSISQEYDELLLRVYVRTEATSAGSGVNIYVNGDTTDTNYLSQRQQGFDGSANQNETNTPLVGIASNGGGPAGYFILLEIVIPNYSNTTRNTSIKSKYDGPLDTGQSVTGHSQVTWEASTAAISSLQLTINGQNFGAGCDYELIGVTYEGTGSSGGNTGSLDTSYLLLLNGNGADQSTDIVDSSSYARTITINGTTTELDTTDPRFGSAAIKSNTGGNSTADWLSVLIPEFNVNGDWTVGTWIKWVTLSDTLNEPAIAAKRTAGNISFFISYFSGDILFSWSSNGTTFETTITRTFAPTVGTWQYVSVTKQGANIYIHVDGAQLGATATLTNTIHESSAPFTIIGDTANSVNTDLLIDDYVLVQKALYTSPTYAVPASETVIPLITDTLENLADTDLSDSAVDMQGLIYEASSDTWKRQEKIIATTPLGTETFVEFTGLSGANSWYEIRGNFELSTDDNIQVFFNGDTVESNYRSSVHYVSHNSGGVTTQGGLQRSVGPFCYGSSAGGPAHFLMQIHRMADCAHFFYQGMYIDATGTDHAALQSGSGDRGPNTTEITSIRLQARSGTFDAGSQFILTKVA